jgi:hypothetical protein
LPVPGFVNYVTRFDIDHLEMIWADKRNFVFPVQNKKTHI